MVLKVCEVIHADQNFGGCGTKGARLCCKDCKEKSNCPTVCTKSYEVDDCGYEKESENERK